MILRIMSYTNTHSENKLHSEFEKICSLLEDLALAVKNTFPDDRVFTELYGWLAPAMNRQDAANVSLNLAKDIRAVNPAVVPDELGAFVSHVPQRLGLLKSQVLPQMPGGNIGQSLPAYLASLEVIRTTILPKIGWVGIADETLLPAKLTRRAMSAGRQLETIEKNIPGLSTKVKEIDLAHSVAENLTVDLEALAEAREKVDRAVTETALQKEKMLEDRIESKQCLEVLEQQAVSARKLIEQCEEAYHITTTKGLAGAFDQRANNLAWSMRGWVVGLMIALVAGSILGAAKLTSLSAELASDNPKWGLITTQILLSILSIGAPLWFSWLATKQIGQRFRLSEDYAFKASVAKAYEGYRKEAAKLDPEFSAKLFGSALQRLDEAPLRLVESEQYGSPWQEFANSDSIKQAMKIAPELQSKLMEIVKDTMQNATKASSETLKVVSEANKASSGAVGTNGSE